VNIILYRNIAQKTAVFVVLFTTMYRGKAYTKDHGKCKLIDTEKKTGVLWSKGRTISLMRNMVKIDLFII